MVEALRARYRGIPNLTIPGLKVFADGVVEIPSQTAALTKPYLNTGRSGQLLFTPAKMNALVIEAARRGLNVHIHAIGDRAVKAALDAFEAAREADGRAKLPFSLTHAQFVDPEDIPRFAQLHVMASLQFLWAVADPSTNEQVKPYIDPIDLPLDVPGALHARQRCRDRRSQRLAGEHGESVCGDLPGRDAFRTAGSAGRLPADAARGNALCLHAKLRPSARSARGDRLDCTGKRADLALIDRDVLTVPAEEMRDARVLFTMWGGKIVYGQEP